MNKIHHITVLGLVLLMLSSINFVDVSAYDFLSYEAMIGSDKSVVLNISTYVYAMVIDQAGFVVIENSYVYLVSLVILVLTVLSTLFAYQFLKLRRKHEMLEKAQKQQDNYESLLDYVISSSTQAVAIHDKDMKYLYVSEAYYRQYRISDKEILGKHHYDVFPDLPEKWREVHKRVLKGETISNDRDEYVRDDGTVDYTRWKCIPWYTSNKEVGGLIVYTEVINDLIHKELELKQSNEQLELIMESLPIGIAVNSVDPEVSFNYLNDNFAEFYVTTREELQESDRFWDVVYEDPKFRQEIKHRVLSDIASGDLNRMKWFEVPIKRKGRATRYINAYATPVPSSNLLISTVVDITDIKQKEEEVDHLVKFDLLTDLPNHQYYLTQLQSFDNVVNYPLVLMIMDLNGLKLINDAFGHEVGNEALKIIANILKEVKREGDFVARIGGDEFAIICPNTTHEQANRIIEDIQSRVEGQRIRDIELSLAAGFTLREDKRESLQFMLTYAENNMYKHKVLSGSSSRNEAIRSIFLTLQEKYEEEKIHSNRVSRYCRMIGESLNLSKDDIRELEMAGLYHDIGKISIPDSILHKPDKLSDDEWKIMKNHTTTGYQILKTADRYSNIAEYALSHHERIDGKGYPNGLKEGEIPLFSRIISVADTYEAMTSDRPYRSAMSQDEAIKELRRCEGTQLDAQIVEVFITNVLSQDSVS